MELTYHLEESHSYSAISTEKNGHFITLSENQLYTCRWLLLSVDVIPEQK